MKKVLGFVLVLLLAVGLLYAQDYTFNDLYVVGSIFNQGTSLLITRNNGITNTRLLLANVDVELVADDATFVSQILLDPGEQVGRFPRLAFDQTGTPALVTGDFVLSAGWGTTRNVDAVDGSDNNFVVLVLSNGTGQAANPTVTFTYKGGDFNFGTSNVPIFTCSQTGGTGAIAFITLARGETTVVLTWVATPVAGQTYELSCIGIQRN